MDCVWGNSLAQTVAEQKKCGALTGYQLYAYGDSAGDRELLAAADSAEYRGFSSY